MGTISITVDNPIQTSHLNRMRDIAGSGPLLILTHDNPDPDALASGKALAHLFQESWGIPSRLRYSGLVARAENQTMLKLLTPEWEKSVRFDDIRQYSAIALVDTQPQAGNNSLPNEINPQIVIDHHHPVRDVLKSVDYVDVRPEIGATISLVNQYLEAAQIVPGPDLATAMFYGLQTDTRGLARGASPADEALYVILLNLMDRRKLIQVEQAGLSREYFRAFSQALQQTLVYGKVVISFLGEMHRPDLAAEIADILIRLQSARAALCLGYHESTLYLSLRTEPFGDDAGSLVQKVVVPMGKAGGHGTMAGGQISLAGQNIEKLVGEISRRFLVVMDELAEGEPLIDYQNPSRSDLPTFKD